MLKSESELMKEYNVSRMTLRKSLSLLSNEGYIYSVPGKGNFVRQPDTDIYQFRFDDVSSIIPQVDDIKLLSVTIESPSHEGLDNIFLKSEQLVRIDRLIYSNNEAIAVELVYTPYIPNRPVVEDKLNFANYSKVIEMKYAFAIKKEVQIRVSTAPQYITKKLILKKDDPIFCIEKRILNKENNNPLTLCILYIKKEHFHLTAKTPEDDQSKKIF